METRPEGGLSSCEAIRKRWMKDFMDALRAIVLGFQEIGRFVCQVIDQSATLIDKQQWYEEIVEELYDDGRMGGEG